MPRFTSFLALLVGMTLALASPMASRAQGDRPAVGEAVPYVDAEGTPRGSITVTEIADPFEGFNPDYPPDAGNRLVAVTVAFDADAGDRFDVGPSDIVLQDSDGFLWNPGSVFFAEDMLIPELSSQTLAPGSRITGVVGFVLPDGTEPARVFYQPESSRLLTLAELTDAAPPAPGAAVDLTDANGGTGQVTVSEFVDPFTAFDPAYPPPDGTRFVALTLAYENTGEGRFDVEPYGLLLRDGNGNLWNTASLYRPAEGVVVPDLSSDQLAPGDRISGVVGFAVPEGVAPAGLYLSPTSGQLLVLADLGEAAAGTEATPAVAVADDETATAAAEPCLILDSWLAATRERVSRAAAMSVEAAALEDLPLLQEHIAAYAALADEQSAGQPPAQAEAVNKALVATLRGYGASIDRILTAGDAGKDTAVELTEGMNGFNAAGQRLNEIETELGRLASDCGLT